MGGPPLEVDAYDGLRVAVLRKENISSTAPVMNRLTLLSGRDRQGGADLGH
jgi:hypothetical protein